jgi:hypothetical protein
MPTIIGLSLIKMYKSLGIEIYQPNLRAALERDLIRISKGEIKIDDIYSQIKNESLSLYLEIENNIEKLQKSLRNYLIHEKDKDKDSIFNLDVEEDVNENGSLTPEIILDKVDIDKEFENLDKEKKDLEEFRKELKNKNHSINNINKEKNKLILENSLRKTLGVKLKGVDNNNDSETDYDSYNENEENKNQNKEKKINPGKNILDINYNCPNCENYKLRIAQNKFDKNYFINCLGFPKCKFSVNIKNPKKVIALDDKCVKCEEIGLKNHMWEIHFLKEKNDKNLTSEEVCLVCTVKNKDIKFWELKKFRK